MRGQNRPEYDAGPVPFNPKDQCIDPLRQDVQLQFVTAANMAQTVQASPVLIDVGHLCLLCSGSGADLNRKIGGIAMLAELQNGASFTEPLQN